MAIQKSTLKQRGEVFYLHYFEHGRRVRRSLETTSHQLALEKQRQFDSARARGEDILLPTKTPLADAIEAYVEHMRTTRTSRAVTADLSYLRGVFGEIAPSLKSRKSSATKKNKGA